MSELIVLGSCGAWPEAGRACAGFLLTHQGFRVVLDLGFGTLPRLLAQCQDGAVDAVIVTHEHPDHCVDVTGLARVRHYLAPDEPPIPLHTTPGTLRRLEVLEPRPHPATVFAVHELGPPRQLGPFRLTAFPLPHYVPTFGIRLDAPGLSVAYTGDTGPSPALTDLARDADLLICEATLQADPPGGEPRYLMTAADAGRLATLANVKTLLLTHFWPGSDRAVSLAQARAEFAGTILTAEEDALIPLP
ncbi:MBL fold metallo-hydrolase [Amycolatopsis sp. H20-H5]|uniref:MBL fold metallo-hydrolase n=1 Tax=Amycolatopsis sp. H20-H5 TaxID=3046309 RepID=UPI002DBA4E83|nr:MBL fold metallo-hydrolase [Amycolatopsis sp. H20-H5]MEC3981856.1 MBL fold metallo-hydrolase [Amycolatopsis sp. H20-H5]